MAKTTKMISETVRLIQEFFKETDIVIEPRDINKCDIEKLIIHINKDIDEPCMRMIHHNLCDIVVIVFLATMCM